jgi:hypothetical protein
MLHHNLFVAGVPATGKSWLGQWLAQKHGYVDVDAERAGGEDFDRAGIHSEWDDLISAGRAPKLVTAIARLSNPVIIDWGFPTRFLYVVCALQAEGVQTYWIHAERHLARQAFINRGGIDVQLDRKFKLLLHLPSSNRRPLAFRTCPPSGTVNGDRSTMTCSPWVPPRR